MRSYIIITVLSALSTCYGATILPKEVDSSEEYIISTVYSNGTIVYGGDLEFADARSSLLSEWSCEAPAISGQSQSISLKYIGDSGDIVRRLTTSIYGDPQVSYTPLGSSIFEMTITSRTSTRISAKIAIFV